MLALSFLWNLGEKIVLYFGLLIFFIAFPRNIFNLVLSCAVKNFFKFNGLVKCCYTKQNRVEYDKRVELQRCYLYINLGEKGQFTTKASKTSRKSSTKGV